VLEFLEALGEVRASGGGEAVAQRELVALPPPGIRVTCIAIKAAFLAIACIAAMPLKPLE
jgi:hypothetical protein